MTKFKYLLAAAAWLVPLAAYAAGTLTNGLPQVAPGATYYGSNGLTNSAGGSLFTYSGELGGYELLPLDTGLGQGAQPQSVSATPFQISSMAAVMNSNAATATSGAATLSTTYGVITSEALTTAAAGSYTLTLTNTTVTAASKVQVGAYLAAGTTGALQIVSVTPATGSVVIVVKNVGSAALNAAIKIPFQVQ